MHCYNKNCYDILSEFFNQIQGLKIKTINLPTRNSFKDPIGTLSGNLMIWEAMGQDNLTRT